jgi:hypothetical protein
MEIPSKSLSYLKSLIIYISTYKYLARYLEQLPKKMEYTSYLSAFTGCFVIVKRYRRVALKLM